MHIENPEPVALRPAAGSSGTAGRFDRLGGCCPAVTLAQQFADVWLTQFPHRTEQQPVAW